MKRTLIAGLSGVALILTPTLAYAQGTGPDTVACQEASVRVERAATDAVDASDLLVDAQQTIEARLHADVVAARAELLRAQTALLAGVNLDRSQFAVLTRAVADAGAALTLALSVVLDDAVPSDLTSNLAELRAALQVEIDARVAACADGAEPTPVPPTSAPPTAAPAPPVSGDEFDCGDFPLGDGRTAQAVLDADPADPNRLDRDRDGSACEVVDDAPSRDGSDTDTDSDDFNQVGNGSVPRGGVATGG